MIFDEDGNGYIDYIGSWGPMIVGHAHPQVVKAVQESAAQGLSFGTPTPIETQLAKKITELIPSIELIRMVNSGTEATMSAIRLARGYTGRDKIIKFTGCYHGHADSLQQHVRLLLQGMGRGGQTSQTRPAPGHAVHRGGVHHHRLRELQG